MPLGMPVEPDVNKVNKGRLLLKNLNLSFIFLILILCIYQF